LLKIVRRSLFFVGLKTANGKRRTQNREPRTKAVLYAAFSLIEVTLAMLVVSVGILAVLGLFPLGLDQNARAIADSHAGLFVEEVFSGLRACAETNWDGLSIDTTLSSANYPGVGVTRFSGTNMAVHTNVYSNSVTHIVDHALRYRLTLNSNGNIKAAMLCVWDGQFGSTNAAPNVFYQEFFNYKP
jgi:type II secretory pathway pseudopilin PulG